MLPSFDIYVLIVTIMGCVYAVGVVDNVCSMLGLKYRVRTQSHRIVFSIAGCLLALPVVILHAVFWAFGKELYAQASKYRARSYIKSRKR